MDEEFTLPVKAFFLGFAVVIAISAIGLLWARFVHPFAEETRRKTQIESQAYQDGMATDLDNLCREWRTNKDVGTKAILSDAIRLRSSRYAGKLPAHVEVCVNEVR